MKYAKKIELPIDFDSIQINRKIQTVATNDQNLAKFEMFYIKQVDVSLIKSILPFQVQSKLLSVRAASYSILSPHAHLREKSVINFYKKVNGEITTFYSGDVVRDETINDPSGNLEIIKLDGIVPCEQFCAEQGDLWILDTTQPHSVTVKGDTRVGRDRYFASDDKERMLIQMYFDLSYAELSHFI